MVGRRLSGSVVGWSGDLVVSRRRGMGPVVGRRRGLGPALGSQLIIFWGLGSLVR